MDAPNCQINGNRCPCSCRKSRNNWCCHLSFSLKLSEYRDAQMTIEVYRELTKNFQSRTLENMHLITQLANQKEFLGSTVTAMQESDQDDEESNIPTARPFYSCKDPSEEMSSHSSSTCFCDRTRRVIDKLKNQPPCTLAHFRSVFSRIPPISHPTLQILLDHSFVRLIIKNSHHSEDHLRLFG